MWCAISFDTETRALDIELEVKHNCLITEKSMDMELLCLQKIQKAK